MAEVGLVSALASLASVPSNILWGNLSDTTGKRRMFVIIGFGGMALSLLLMALSTSIGDYLFANLLFGLLTTAAAPVGTVLILESFDKKEWAKRLGDFSRVGGIGWVIGLLLGTIWLQFFVSGEGASAPMRALFMVASLLSVLSMFLALKWVPEPENNIKRSEISGHVSIVPLMIFERARYAPQRVLHIMRISSHNLNPHNFPANLKWYFVSTFILWSGFLSFYVALPIFLSNYVSVSEVFVIYMASSAVSAITYSQAGRWVSRIGGKRIETGAVLGRIFLFPSFFLVTLLPLSHLALLAAFCALHALVGFCWANISVSSNTMVSLMCYHDFRAESTGMFNSIIGMASITGALVGGFIAQYFGYLAVFGSSSIFLVTGLALLLRIDVDKVPAEADSPHAVHA